MIGLSPGVVPERFTCYMASLLVGSASQIDCLGRGTTSGSKPPFRSSGVYHFAAKLKEFTDLQVAKASTGIPTGCTIYHHAEVPDIEEGDMPRVLT